MALLTRSVPGRDAVRVGLKHTHPLTIWRGRPAHIAGSPRQNGYRWRRVLSDPCCTSTGNGGTRRRGRRSTSTNPATGEVIGTVGRRRRRRRAGGDRGRRRRVRRVVDAHRVRAVGVPVPGVPAHARAPRGAGQAHDRGAGQADPHGPQRGGLRGRLPALVRRGGQARLRRDHPVGTRRPALPRAAPAGGRRRRDHAVELPGVDAHPEDRARARRRLHDRAEAGRADAAARGRGVQDLRGHRAARGRREPRHHRAARRPSVPSW